MPEKTLSIVAVATGNTSTSFIWCFPFQLSVVHKLPIARYSKELSEKKKTNISLDQRFKDADAYLTWRWAVNELWQSCRRGNPVAVIHEP
jgi:hypothetical protein